MKSKARDKIASDILDILNSIPCINPDTDASISDIYCEAIIKYSLRHSNEITLLNVYNYVVVLPTAFQLNGNSKILSSIGVYRDKATNKLGLLLAAKGKAKPIQNCKGFNMDSHFSPLMKALLNQSNILLLKELIKTKYIEPNKIYIAHSGPMAHEVLMHIHTAIFDEERNYLNIVIDMYSLSLDKHKPLPRSIFARFNRKRINNNYIMANLGQELKDMNLCEVDYNILQSIIIARANQYILHQKKIAESFISNNMKDVEEILNN